MAQSHRSRIRPGNLAMAIGVIVPAFVIDVWYMEWIDIFWSRSAMFVIKAFLLGAWYENTREQLITFWVSEPNGVRNFWNYQSKVFSVDGCFAAAFNGGIYAVLVLIQHGMQADKSLTSSLFATLAVCFFSLFTGPLLGLLIDAFRRLWKEARYYGLKRALCDCHKVLCNTLFRH